MKNNIYNQSVKNITPASQAAVRGAVFAALSQKIVTLTAVLVHAIDTH